MPGIHYFPRYLGSENAATNNTLLLVGRIYEHSPIAASQFLTEICGEPITIGIEISQQERERKSVPDGLIIQESFKVLVEAKAGTPVNPKQLLEHAKSFKGEEQKILFLLTKIKWGERDVEKIRKEILGISKDIVFVNITYKEICDILKDQFQEWEVGIRQVVEDYEAYCMENGLYDQQEDWMRIVPCIWSFPFVEKYGIYFHPSDMGYDSEFAYHGIYYDRTVHYVLRYDSVFDAKLNNETLEKTHIHGGKTDEYDDKIKKMIAEVKAEAGRDISNGYRFFCGKESYATCFKKASSRGMWQRWRFVNLKEIVGTFSDTKDLAEKLRGKEWK